MKKIIKLCIFIFLLCVYILWQLAPTKIFGDVPPVTITIPRGATAKEIGKILKDNHLIRSRFWFDAYVRLAGRGSAFQAGEYQVFPESVAALVKKFTGHPERWEMRVTIIEGWDLGEIAEALKPVGVSPDEFFARAGKPLYLRRDKSYQKSLEGYLFPDTYFFRRGSSASEVITRMQDNFNRRVGDISDRERIIITASLLQAEVRDDKDMRMVADIINRRLKAGMGLQIDATVNYITGNKIPTATDLKIDSPYNTYRYRGLPPGPISNPGLQAIQAAQNPLPNNYWYYLTGQDGAVHYGRTLDEHRANRRYL